MLDLDESIRKRHTSLKNTQTNILGRFAATGNGTRLAVRLATEMLSRGKKATQLRLEPDLPDVTILGFELTRLLSDGVEDLMVVTQLPNIGKTLPETLVVCSDNALGRLRRITPTARDQVAPGTGQRENGVAIIRTRWRRPLLAVLAALGRTRHRLATEQALALKTRDDTIGGKRMPIEARVDDRASRNDTKDTDGLEGERLALRTRDLAEVLPIITLAGVNAGPPESTNLLVVMNLRNDRNRRSQQSAGHDTNIAALTTVSNGPVGTLR